MKVLEKTYAAEGQNGEWYHRYQDNELCFLLHCSRWSSPNSGWLLSRGSEHDWIVVVESTALGKEESRILASQKRRGNETKWPPTHPEEKRIILVSSYYHSHSDSTLQEQRVDHVFVHTIQTRRLQLESVALLWFDWQGTTDIEYYHEYTFKMIL